MTTRVLITGATGFIGRHCLPRLLQPAVEVHGVARQPPPPDFVGPVTWHAADLLDARDVTRVVAAIRPTHLLHLAWSSTRGRWADALDHFRWTTAGLDLLRAFAAAGGRRATVAGTCAEYDWSAGFCTEGDPAATPATTYGAAKRALGLMSESYAAASGVSLAWARIFFVYGPHEPAGRLVPTVIRALCSGQIAACTPGDQQRDYLFVGDVADALVRLLHSDLTGPVNIASGEPLSVRDLTGHLARKLDGASLLALGRLPAPDEPPLVIADVTRLRSQLQWQPAWSLDAGLDETIAWWRNRLQSAPPAGSR